MTRMAPKLLEKKLYGDVARVICCAFDRAVMEANGFEIWGLELGVKGSKDSEMHLTEQPRRQSLVGVEQIEIVVDKMLQSRDLRVPFFMEHVQRQLITNCTLMILQLIEDLASDR